MKPMSIANNRQFQECGRSAGLEPLINPNSYFKKSENGRRIMPNGTMATTIEALIGAVWMDSDGN
jgi:dsRNA-specific ribonuclease